MQENALFLSIATFIRTAFECISFSGNFQQLFPVLFDDKNNYSFVEEINKFLRSNCGRRIERL